MGGVPMMIQKETRCGRYDLCCVRGIPRLARLARDDNKEKAGVPLPLSACGMNEARPYDVR